MKKVFLFCLFLFFAASPVKALESFQTDFAVTYQINPRGDATVHQTITLTNNFSNIYPTEYLLETSEKVQNISAWDEKGNILAEVKEKKDTTEIRLRFNQQVVGKGKKLVFHVQYQLPQWATHKGRVWEIALPKLSHPEKINSFVLTVIVPNSFGKLAYSSARIKKIENLGIQTKLVFEKNSLRGNNLISFGDFQSFDFALKYLLTNPHNEPGESIIPLPPQTNYQEVIFTKIDPLPKRIFLDENGNWLGEYLLSPREKFTVTVQGQVKIFASPQKTSFYNQEKTLPLFLKEDQYWETSHPQIIRLAQELKTPQKIYQFVVSHLQYDYQAINEKVERKGAVAALARPQESVCTEFTDLFIALCRAAGIPAREIEGFAYTNNPKLKPLSLEKNILHAWPEYWDKSRKEWVQVDPTWEKTTGGVDYFHNFDFNHFAFVIHGTSSSSPSPPGNFSLPNEKTIQVSFARQPVVVLPKKTLQNLSFSFQRKKESSFLFKNLSWGEIVIKNKNLHPVENLKLEIVLPGKEKTAQTVELLPPLGEEKITVPLPPWWKQLIDKPAVEISLSLGSFREEKSLSLPFFVSQEKLLGKILVVSGSIFLFFFLLWKAKGLFAKRG